MAAASFNRPVICLKVQSFPRKNGHHPLTGVIFCICIIYIYIYMCVCVCVRDVHIYIYIYIHIYTYTCTSTVHVHVHVPVPCTMYHAFVQCICTMYMRMHMYRYMYRYRYMYICMYLVSMYCLHRCFYREWWAGALRRARLVENRSPRMGSITNDKPSINLGLRKTCVSLMINFDTPIMVVHSW